MTIKTSETHPLRIDCVQPLDQPGRIGMTLCPGKQQHWGLSGHWARDLDADLRVIAESGARTLVSLIEDHEFKSLKVESLGEQAQRLGLEWLHLPIVDRGLPDSGFEQHWREWAGERLRQRLKAGELVVLHCMGGLGRTGTLAARLLIELGESPASAIGRVRAARRGTIETDGQEDYVRHCRWVEALPA
jgi:ADP-ribosyl-[dinitrogen reductase] hydrolase